MAATISQANVRRVGGPMGIRFERCVDYTGPASYPTGGDPFLASDVGLGVIEMADFGIATDASNANPRLLVYDITNNVVHWYVPNTGAEVAAAVNLSGYTVRVQFFGK